MADSASFFGEELGYRGAGAGQSNTAIVEEFDLFVKVHIALVVEGAKWASEMRLLQYLFME